MNNPWYFAQGNKIKGPIEFGHLQTLVVSGQIQPGDMVIRAGESQWVPASSVMGLSAQVNGSQQATVAAAAPSRSGLGRKLIGWLTPGVILALLLIGALAAATALLFQERAELVQEKSSLQARVDELEKAQRNAAREAPKVSSPELSAEKKGVHEAEIGVLKNQIAKLESLRADDAKMIKSLNLRLAKDPVEPKEDITPVPPPPLPKKKGNPYELIDRHALEAPRDAESSLDRLAKYLTGPADNDEEKVRAIFRWVADRVEYDADAFFSGKINDQRAETVLKSRKCVCAGYANLFAQLGKRAGLQVFTIYGFSKGVGWAPGERFKSNHAWNAVRVNGAWRLFDVTWGAGHLKGREYVKGFDEFFFCAVPELLVISHFPDDPRWQLLSPPVTLEEYRNVVLADDRQVRGLVAYGLLKQEGLLQALKQRQSAGWPKAWPFPDENITILAAPLEKELRAGTKLSLKVNAPDVNGVMIKNNKRFLELKQSGGIYEGTTANLEPGAVTVGVRFAGKGLGYWTVLEYVVK